MKIKAGTMKVLYGNLTPYGLKCLHEAHLLLAKELEKEIAALRETKL